jgi:hypothetical protein
VSPLGKRSGDDDEPPAESWLDAPEAPAGEPDADAAADAEPLTPAEAPEPEPAPEADPPPAADAASVDEAAGDAFAAAGVPPPPLGDSAPPRAGDDAPPPWADRIPASGGALTERPEALIGAAFAGGVVFALILKRLAR